MVEYLKKSLTKIEGLFCGSGMIIGRDFNQLNITHLCHQFKLKQLDDKPTRGACTLDLVLTST